MTADVRLVPVALAAWLVGAIAVGQDGDGRQVLLGVLAGVGGVALLLGLRPTRRRHRAPWQSGTAAALLACVAGTGVVVSVNAQDAVRERGIAQALAWGGRSVVEVRIDGGATPVPGGFGGSEQVRIPATLLAVTIRGERTGAHAPVLLLAGGAWADLPVGAHVEGAARVRAGEPGERPAALVVLDGEAHLLAHPPPWRGPPNAMRTSLRAAVAGLAPHAQGLLPGIGVGDDSAVPPELARVMRVASLGHLLAVSGAHVAIVLALVLVAAGGWSVHARVGLGAAVLVALVVVVGPEASVVRAAVMGVVALLALGLGRRSSALAALAAGVVVLIVLDPWIARSLGFALSVSATAGLVLGARPLTQVLATRVPGPLAAAVAIPLAAQLGALPAALAVEEGIPTYGVLANALVAPVIPVLTVLALAATVLAPLLPGLAHGALWLAQPGTWWIEAVAVRVAALPVPRLPWPGGAAGVVSALVLIGAVLAVVRNERARTAVAAVVARFAGVAPFLACALALGVLASLVVPALRPVVAETAGGVVEPAFPPPGWRVIVCDVGQGSALLVSTAAEGGGDEAVMVDVGGEGGAATRCLRGAGVRDVALLVLTHADADHAGALAEVLGAVGVAELAHPAAQDPRQAELNELAADVGARVTALTAQDPVRAVGVLMLRPLWPTVRAVEIGGDSPNDLSLTTWIEAPELTLLAHGDLSAVAQQGLARAWPADLAGARPDVLLLPHHGSPDTDHASLAAVLGRVAVVSVGADNDYGHPAQAVLETVEAAGSLLARTDTCGDIAIGRPVGAREGELVLAGCP